MRPTAPPPKKVGNPAPKTAMKGAPVNALNVKPTAMPPAMPMKPTKRRPF